jgi:HD-GYP domain-containing protein (c-di-GMP phosphodiesterase class II)
MLSDPEFAPWHEQALSQGCISAFACPLWINHRIIGSLAIYATEAFTADERVLLEQLAHDLAFGIETLRTRSERDRLEEGQQQHARLLQKSLEQSIQAIIDTVEKRDPYISGHQHRVGVLSERIAQEMGLEAERVHGIRLAATVHDLGKIQVPAEILSKPGKLSDIELMLIKTHPQAGYDILKDVDFPWPIATMVWQHHERMDGSGYPQGLKGDEILLESRILAVADVIEAMASHRPYRAALGIEVALAEIERGRGNIYDPMVVDICLKLFRERRFTFPK